MFLYPTISEVVSISALFQVTIHYYFSGSKYR